MSGLPEQQPRHSYKGGSWRASPGFARVVIHRAPVPLVIIADLRDVSSPRISVRFLRRVL